MASRQDTAEDSHRKQQKFDFESLYGPISDKVFDTVQQFRISSNLGAPCRDKAFITYTVD